LIDSQVSTSTVLALLLAHSFSSALMFATSGMLSARYHTRDFTQLSGVFTNTPRLAFIFLVGSLFAGAFPLGVVFISEVYAISTLALFNHTITTVLLLFIYSLVF
jgi:NADH:ubiquinone oxidoreductase subunit 4 (subunit M)